MKVNKVVSPDMSVVLTVEVFGEVVGEIVGTFRPINIKLALVNSILNPIESHVDGLGESLFDLLVSEA